MGLPNLKNTNTYDLNHWPLPELLWWEVVRLQQEQTPGYKSGRVECFFDVSTSLTPSTTPASWAASSCRRLSHFFRVTVCPSATSKLKIKHTFNVTMFLCFCCDHFWSKKTLNVPTFNLRQCLRKETLRSTGWPRNRGTSFTPVVVVRKKLYAIFPKTHWRGKKFVW